MDLKKGNGHTDIESMSPSFYLWLANHESRIFEAKIIPISIILSSTNYTTIDSLLEEYNLSRTPLYEKRLPGPNKSYSKNDPFSRVFRDSRSRNPLFADSNNEFLIMFYMIRTEDGPIFDSRLCERTHELEFSVPHFYRLPDKWYAEAYGRRPAVIGPPLWVTEYQPAYS